MLAILRFLSISLQAEHIASGLCLGNGQTDELFAGQNVGDDFGLELRAAEIKDWWQTNDFSA